MARGITENEVWKACDALLLEGARPTIERVRQKLGRGSPNTVSPMLETWFRHLGARIKDPGSFCAPASVPDLVQQAAVHLWEAAQAEARHDVASQVKVGIAQATTQAEEASLRAANADAAAISARGLADRLQTQLDLLRQALETERSAHAATSARLQESHLRQHELQREIEDARKALEDERQRCTQSIALSIDRAAAAERRAAMEIDRERTQRAKAEKSLEGLTKRYEDSLRSQTGTQEQLARLELEVTHLRAQMQKQSDQSAAELDQRISKIQDLEAELATVKSNLATASSQQALVERLVAHLGSTVQPRAKHAKSSQPAQESRSKPTR